MFGNLVLSFYYYGHYLEHRSVQMAEWIALPTSDHGVPDLNPPAGGIQLVTTEFHCTEPFIMALPSDLNDVERDVKHQVITIFILCRF